MQLVSGKGKQVHIGKPLHKIYGEFPHCLRRIGVEHDARIGLFGDAGQLIDREDDAGFVVCVHDGDEQRAGRQCLNKFPHIQVAIPIDSDIGHLIPAAFEFLADFKHGRVFNGSRNDMPPVWIPVRRADDGGIVALRRTAGKEDFLGIDVSEAIRDGLARFGDRMPRLPRRFIHGTRIKVIFREIRLHRLVHFRGDTRGGVVVDVNDFHRSAYTSMTRIRSST